MPPYTLKHRDDCERNGEWSLVRRSLDLHAFGINLVEIPPGGSIPRHNEVERDQEEVFFTISGTPTVIVDDEELPAPPGTFIRVDAEPKRTVKNDGLERAAVLIMSAPRSSGYKPMTWA